jgi:ORF6N domain-containing protein
MLQLTKEKFESLRSQTVISNLKSQFAISSSGWGGRQHPPYAFTEQGVAMLSSFLRSKRAVAINIEILRAFVRFLANPGKRFELSGALERLELLEPPLQSGVERTNPIDTTWGNR